MDIKELVESLREKLKPSGTLGLVHLHLPSAASFVEGDLVNQAIDELEKKMLYSASGIIGKEDFSALEKLAINLLLNSV